MMSWKNSMSISWNFSAAEKQKKENLKNIFLDFTGLDIYNEKHVKFRGREDQLQWT